MQRAEWLAQSRRRWRALPMVMLLADRLSSSSAPAIAARVDGGSGTQMSSQISTWKVNGTDPVERNSRSTPNGTSLPATTTCRPRTPAPGVKCRRS